MSEKITQNNQPPLIEELERIDIFDENTEATRASVEDFQSLEGTAQGLMDRFVVSDGPYRRRYRHVETTSFLRQPSQPDDAPRFRVMTDPDGEQNGTSKAGGYPTVSFRFEQGKRTQFTDKLNEGKKGSWDLAIDIIERDGEPIALIQGAMKTGRKHNDREGLSVSRPVSILPASVELLDWIKNQIGDPETLVPAPTKTEKRQARFWGAVGLSGQIGAREIYEENKR